MNEPALLLGPTALFRRLASGLDPVSRGWAVLVGGQGVRLALGLAASVLVARALGPAGFGIYAILAAVSNVAGVLADFGLTDAAVARIASAHCEPGPTAEWRARAFFWTRTVTVGLVVAVGGVFSGPLAAHVLNLPGQGVLLALTLLGVWATALSGAVAAILQAYGRFGSMALLGLANAGATSLLAGILAISGQLTLFSAVAVLGIGTSLCAFAVGVRMLAPARTLRPPELAVLRAEGRALARSAPWLGIANTLAMLAASLDLLLLHRWVSAEDLGAYALAVNLATKVDGINQSLYTVLLPSAAGLRGQRAEGRYLRDAVVRGAIAALLIVVVALAADPLISFFYGPAYTASVGWFRVLLALVVLDLFATPLVLLALGYQRTRLIATADGVRAATVFGVIAGLVPFVGLVGAPVARVTGRLLGVGVILAGLTHRRLPDAPSPAQRIVPS